MEKVIIMAEDQLTDGTEQKEGISISTDDYLDNAISKIIEGTEMTLYISEKMARKIAAAVLEKKVTIKNIPIKDINDLSKVLCQAEIEIIYDD